MKLPIPINTGLSGPILRINEAVFGLAFEMV